MISDRLITWANFNAFEFERMQTDFDPVPMGKPRKLQGDHSKEMQDQMRAFKKFSKRNWGNFKR